MLTSTLRVEESLDRAHFLHADILEWTEQRRKLDTRKQFATQLASLDGTLSSALERLLTIASEFPSASAGQTYELCRDFDSCLLTVRRLWRWFADKFDQRDVKQFCKTLCAADEVAWSIHAGIMRAAHDGDVLVPAPLPYLDELDAPEAVPRDNPPPDLRLTDFDEALRLLLARLPIAVVALGPDTLRAPWELALLGHEVGHHLQYDLLRDQRLVTSVGEAVAAAAGSGEGGSKWRWWSRELFADLVGLVTIGPSSLAALLPLEFGTDHYMLGQDRERYPAPAVRIALITAMADQLGLDLADTLRASAPDQESGWADTWAARAPAPIRAYLDQAPDIAAALVSCRVTDEESIATLSGFSPRAFLPGGAVWDQAEQLMRNDRGAETGIRVARSLASAGVIAYEQLSTRPGVADRPRRLVALGDVLVDRIIASAEEGTRAAVRAEVKDADMIAVGAEMADRLTRGLMR